MYDPRDFTKVVGDLDSPDALFRGKTWEDVGKDDALTSYLHKKLDPDGSKYGGDTEKLKTGFLNDQTFRTNSITAQTVDWMRSKGANREATLEGNLFGRLYETAPNRLIDKNASWGDAGQALWSGVKGAVVGEGGGDLILNALLTPATLGFLGAKTGLGLLKPFASGATNVAEKIVGGKAVQGALAEGATDAALEAVKRGIPGDAVRSAMWQGAKQEAAINAPLAMGSDALEQAKNENYGLQSEYSLTQGLLAAGLGGVVGGAFGAAGNIPMGVRVGREITGASPEKLLRAPEGEFAPTLAGERARLEQQAILERAKAAGADVDNPEIAPGFTMKDFQESFGDMKEALANRTAEATVELRERANEIRMGSMTDSVWQADTVDRMASVLGRMANDPELSVKNQMNVLLKAQAAGDMDAVGLARAEGEGLLRLFRWIKDNPNGFDQLTDRIPDEIVEALALRDAKLAELVGRDREVAANPKAPPSQGMNTKAPPAAGSGPSTGSSAGGAAPAAPTQPSAPSAGAAPDVAPGPQASGASPQQTTPPAGETAAPPPQAPPPGNKIADVESTMTEKERGAVSALSEIAAKAQTTADDIVARVDAGEAPSVVAADIAARSGAEVPQATQVISTATAAVKRARGRKAQAEAPATAAAPEAPAAAATPPAGAAATEQAAAPKAETPAENEPEVEPTIKEAEAQFAGASQSAIGERINLVHFSVMNDLDRALKIVDSADLTPEKLAELQANPETAPLWKGVDIDRMATEQSRNEIKAEMRKIARAAVSTYVADFVSRVMPDPINVGHFHRLLTLFPSVSETVRRSIAEDYTKMVRSALAEEVGRLGTVDAVVQRYGPEAQKLLVGETAKKRAKRNPKVADKLAEFDASTDTAEINLKAILADLGDDEARSFVAKQLRDFRKQLDLTPLRADAEMMDAALRRRASSAVQEFYEANWAKNNPDDARRLAALRAMRQTNAANRQQAIGEIIALTGFDSVTADDLSGQLVNVSWTGGLSGTRGAMFDNPVVDRLRPGGKWGRLVSGRIQSRQMDGTIQGTSTTQGVITPAVVGTDFFGALYANPTRALPATFRARDEIYGAAIQRAASNQKEKVGLVAEQINRRVEFARMQAITSAQKKRMAGEFSEDQFRKQIGLIEAASRKVTDDEIAVAWQFLNAQEQLDKANAAAKAKMADVMALLADGGLDQDAVILKIFDDLQKTQAKVGPSFLSSVEKLTSPGGRVTKKKAASAGATADPPPTRNPEPDATVSVKATGDEKVRELRANKEIVFGEDGILTLFGKRIGSWTPAEKGGKQVVLDGWEGGQMQPVADGIDLARRKPFLKHKPIQKILDDNKGDLPPADERVVQNDGEVIPENASKAKEIDEAVSEVKVEPTVPEQMNTPWSSMTLPPGRRWALLNKTTGVVYRVRQSADGVPVDVHATPAKVAGKYLGQHDFVVGTVPMLEVLPNGKTRGTHTNPAYALANFVPYGRDTGQPDARVIERAALGEQNKGVLKEVLEARRGPVSMKVLGKIPVEGMDNIATAADLVANFDSISMRLRTEDIPTKEMFDQLLRQAEQMATRIEEIAPFGIDRGNVSRRTAHQYLRQHLASAKPEDVDAAIAFLRRLDVEDKKGYPYFQKSEVYPAGTVVNGVDVSGRAIGDYYASADNRIGIDAAGQLTDAEGKLVVPRHISVVHEGFHWAYLNILSPKERVQFLRTLEKYFDQDGALNVDRMREDMPGLNELLEATGKRSVGTGVNELFAWQGTSWYLQKARGANVAAEESLWRKVVHYVKNLLTKMVHGKVDPDLIPLFERIMPSSPMETRFDYSALRQVETGKMVPTGEAVDASHASAMKKLYVVQTLDKLRSKLDEHLFNSAAVSEAGLAQDLKEAGTFLYLTMRPVKGRDGKTGLSETGRRIRRALFGDVNKDKEGLDLFGANGAGKIMEAYREISSAMRGAEDADGAKAFGEIVDGVNEGKPEFEAIAGAIYEPDIAARFNETVAEVLKTIKEKAPGTSDEMAQNAAAIMASRMLGLSNSSFSEMTARAANISIGKADLLLKMAADLRDMLVDSMDSVGTSLKSDGYALVKNRRHIPEPPPTERTDLHAEIADEIKAAEKAEEPKPASDPLVKRVDELEQTVRSLERSYALAVRGGDEARIEELQAKLENAVDSWGKAKASLEGKGFSTGEQTGREEQMPSYADGEEPTVDAPEVSQKAKEVSLSTLQADAQAAIAKAVEGKTGAEAVAAEQAAVAPYYEAIRNVLASRKDVETVRVSGKMVGEILSIDNIDEMRTTYRELVATGNAAEIIAAERRLRELERVAQRGDAPADPNVSEAVMNLRRLDGEIARESVAPSDVAPGIPPLSNPQMKTLLSRVTHRQQAVRDSSRRMAYRLLKLTGVEEPTNAQLADLMGLTAAVDNPDALSAGGKVAKDFIKEIRWIAEMAGGRVDEKDGPKLNASDAAGTVAEMIVNSRMKDADFEAKLRGMDQEFEALRKSFKTPKEFFRHVALSFYEERVQKQAGSFDLKRYSDVAPEATALALDIAKEARWVVEGAITAKSMSDKLHLGLVGVPTGKGQHPAFAMRQVSELLESMDPGMLATLAGKIGIPGDDATKARVARSIMFHQPGAAARVGTLGTGSVRLVANPDVNLAARQAADLVGDDPSARILLDTIQSLDNRLLDRSISAAEIRGLTAKRDAALQVLRNRLGTDFSDAAVPMIVDTEKLFDLGNHSNKLQLAVVARTYAASVGNPQALSSLSEIVRAGDGQRLYDTMVSTVGKAKAHQLLADAGFIGTRAGNDAEVFKADSVKRLMKEVDFGDRVSVPDDADRVPITSELFMALTAADGEAKPSAAGVQSRALSNGNTEKQASILSKLVPGGRQRLTNDEVVEITKFGRVMQLRSNPARMLKSGAKHLAGLTETFFETRDAFLGKHLSPAMRALDKIAGAHGYGKKWFSEVVRNSKAWSDDVPQSAAEERIARAMLGGDAKVAMLKPEERAVAIQLRDQFFKKLLQAQNENGLKIRDITGGDQGSFYLPHRLRVDRLEKDFSGAVKKWAAWFKSQNPGDSEAEVTERATKMVINAINDWEYGGYLGGSTYAQSFGEASYQRVLRMTPEEMEKFGLADYFDTNLRSLVIGYAQGAANRIEVSKRYGLGGHVLRTYLGIATEGDTAAADALLQRKTFTPDKVAQDAPGKSVTFPVEVYKPLTDDPEKAREIVAQVRQILSGEGNPDTLRKAASDYLQSLYEAKGAPGADNFRKAADAIVGAMADFSVKGKILDSEEAKWIEGAVHHLAGKPAYMTGLSKPLRTASSAVLVANNVTLLSMATLASIPDLGMSLFRSGSIGSYMKSLAQNLSEIRNYDSAFRNAQRDLGVTMESILNENITNAHGGKIGRLGNGYFWLTGLTPWTNAMREIAATTGYYSIKANQEMLKRLRMTQQTDTVKYRRGLRYLRQLGMAHLVDAPTLTNFADDVASNDALRQALLRFTNESVFQPNKNDIPLWAQDPLGKLIFQFKSYPLMFGRFVKRAINESIAMEHREGRDLSWGEILTGKWTDAKYAGNPMPLMMLLTVGVGLGAGAQALRDKAQGRNEEAAPGQSWHTTRERTLTKILENFGLQEHSPDDPEVDAALGWYIEGLIGLGAMGLVGDMIYQSAAAIDNGAYGRERIASLVAGPWTGTFNDALKVLEGGFSAATDAVNEEGTETNAKERQAARALIGRIPGLGQIRSVKEGLVDEWAGEAENPRPAK